MDETRMLQAERKGLIYSAVGALVVGCNGVVFAFLTGAQAIMLDGLFNMTYFFTGLFTLKVVGLLLRGDDERFPMGYGFFEPLVNGIKGVLMLGITVMALVGAAEALFSGGRAIQLGLAVVYGVLATIGCWVVALLVEGKARESHSPLVRADALGWVVNAAISSAVLATLLIVFLIRNTALRSFVPYVDPVLVLVIGGIALGVPIRMAWQALMALLNRAPSAEVLQKTRDIVEHSLAEMPVQGLAVRVLQPGRTRMVVVHVLLGTGFRGGLKTLDDVRGKTAAALRKAYPLSDVDLLFTRDERWHAPLPSSNEPPGGGDS